MGDYYRFSQGVEQDYSESIKWYQLSAEQGNSIAQYCLGFLYREGVGVEQNLGIGIDWYRKSADQVNADAQCCLGDCYRLESRCGAELFLNLSKWYQLSARQGNSVAQLYLGVCGDEGVGVEQNLEFSSRLVS